LYSPLAYTDLVKERTTLHASRKKTKGTMRDVVPKSSEKTTAMPIVSHENPV
jgi:hypothetical protein